MRDCSPASPQEPTIPLLRTLGTVALLEQDPAGERHLDVQPKRLALLVFLRRGGRGGYAWRESLLALLWPEADDEHGRGALRQSLTALRRQLGADTLLTRGTEEVGVAPGCLPCDADQFEAACATGDPEAALALYRGHFLQGFHASGVAPEFEDWMEAERTRLRRMAAAAAWTLAASCESAGRETEAVRVARRAVELAPEDEPGVARLIGLLDRQGDRSGALALYADLERRLAEEFAAAPAPETRAMVQSLLQRPTPRLAEPVAPAPPTSAPTPAPARHDAAPVQQPVSLRRRPMVLGALAGALAVVTLAIVLGAGRHRDTPAHTAVAIMPFRVSAADTSLVWLREGMVELLASRLTGEGGMDVVDPSRSIGAWRRRHRERADSSDPMPREALAALGAGRVIAGTVGGTAGHVVLSASLSTVPSGRRSAGALVEGPIDSLSHLVDRLATQLLGREAGLEEEKLASLTSTAPTAVRAFLAGRAAHRVGRREEALQRFQRALALDSTFALAALEVLRLERTVPAGDPSHAARLARAHMDRLGEADRALLDAHTREWATSQELFARWVAVVNRHRGRADSWYALGDIYRSFGRLAGVDEPLQRAEDAYRRGWQLDSAAGSVHAGAGSLQSMEPFLELVHLRGDTLQVRRLAAIVLAADSSSDLARIVRWHLAVLDGEEARRAYWAGIGAVSMTTTRSITLFMLWTGIGLEDHERAREEDMRRMLVARPVLAVTVQRWRALNTGRPSRVPAVGAPEFGPREDLRIRMRDALWWNADSVDALSAARKVGRQASEAGRRGPVTFDDHWDRCALGLWHAARGEWSQADSTARWLRTVPPLPAIARHDELCVALLAATAASARGAPEALALTDIADSLARSYIGEVSVRIPETNLLLARVWERQGRAAHALRAVQRGADQFRSRPVFLSSVVRETGRLAELTGDTALARASYRHFLLLHRNPDPAVAPEVARVRKALEALSRE